MAYNVKQLEQLQDMIGTEAEVPNALDRYNAMQLLKRKPVRREGGGDMGLHDSVEEVASKGRYGDTMLIHVNPEEVQGLASIAPLTTNPETGLPEAFAFPLIPVLAGAAIGGIGSAVTGGDPLKGAAFGALGGFAGPAIGAAAGGLGLGAAWGGLGAIGQGMLVGGAMGGVRSLFGDSDNPMRDILMGAAMGGMGGALMGDGGGATPDTSLSEAATPLGMRQVPMSQAGQQSPSWLIPSGGTGSMAGAPAPTNWLTGAENPIPQPVIRPTSTMYGAHGAATRPVSTYTNPRTVNLPLQGPPPPPPQTLADVAREANVYSKANVDSYIGAGEDFRESIGFPVEDRFIDPSTGRRFAEDAAVSSTAAGKEAAATATQDAAEKTGLGAWWDRQDNLTKAGIIGGGGLLASGYLTPEPYAPLEEDDEIVEFPRVDPLPIRTPVQRDRDEILAQYLSSSPTAGQPQSWFTEQDVNVAKQGGLVALAHGGMANLAYAGRNEDNAVHGGEVAHISADESDMLRRMGGAGSINPVTGLREYIGTGGGQAGGLGGAVAAAAATGSGSGSGGSGQGQGTVASDGGLGFTYGDTPAVMAPNMGEGVMVRGLDGTPVLAPNMIARYGATLPFGILPRAQNPSQLAQALSSISNMGKGLFGEGSALSGLAEGLSNASIAGFSIASLASALGAAPTPAQAAAIAANAAPTSVGKGGGERPEEEETQSFGGTQTALPAANGGVIKRMGGGAGGYGSGSGGGAGGGGYGGTMLPGSPEYHAQHGSWTPRRRRGGGGGGGSAPVVEEEIEARRFTVNPFNIQERLGAITGSSAPVQIPNLPAQQITLPTEASGALQGLLQRASDLPIVQGSAPELRSTAIEEQGNTALADLLQRAADLPQIEESADGGTVGLATGGNTPVFEGRVMGQGDGMDDDVAFGVVPQTPADIPNTPDMALLSSDEYVMPADVVSMLGNGSSTAGSKMLDQFNQLLRRKAHGTNKQQTQLDAGRELSSLV